MESDEVNQSTQGRGGKNSSRLGTLSQLKQSQEMHPTKKDIGNKRTVSLPKFGKK